MRLRLVLSATLISAGLLAGATGCGEREATPLPFQQKKKGAETKQAAASVADLDMADAKRTFGVLPAKFESDTNPITDAKVALGRMLYFDTRLSKNHDLSCNSCHLLDKYGVDGTKVSKGHRGQLGTRNAPTVYNAGALSSQFWDGRAATLEEQAKGPIQNPIEMGEDPAHLIAELQAIPEYKSRFAAAFAGSADSSITLDHIAAAIAAFERTLLAVNTPFDRYAAGDSTAMPPAAVRGLNLFRSVSTRCFECHGTPTFANPDFKVIGVPSPQSPTQLDADLGRGALLTGKAYLNSFKIPTLRNIAKTAPYMHNGVFKTLEEVLDFYAKGGGLGLGFHQDNIDDKIRKFDLAAGEKADLIAFLNALTDESRRPEIPTQVPSGLPVPTGPLP